MTPPNSLMTAGRVCLLTVVRRAGRRSRPGRQPAMPTDVLRGEAMSAWDGRRGVYQKHG